MFTSSRNSAEPLSGARIVAALKTAGITYVVSVPDISTSEGLLWPISRDPDLKLIRVCKEDEAIGIATGLWATGGRSVILIQNTGFFYALNAIRVLAMEYEQPICLMIGLLLKEPDKQPKDSVRYGVRLVPPVLEALASPTTRSTRAPRWTRLPPISTRPIESRVHTPFCWEGRRLHDETTGRAPRHRQSRPGRERRLDLFQRL